MFSIINDFFFLASKDITILGDPRAVSRVWKGRGRKFAKEPPGTDSHRTISKNSADAGFWLGTENALYHCAQSANSLSCPRKYSTFYTPKRYFQHLYLLCLDEQVQWGGGGGALHI